MTTCDCRKEIQKLMSYLLHQNFALEESRITGVFCQNVWLFTEKFNMLSSADLSLRLCMRHPLQQHKQRALSSSSFLFENSETSDVSKLKVINSTVMSVKTAMPICHSTGLATLKMSNTNQKMAKRVLKKYQGVARRRAAAQSYKRLKKLVPTIKSKENISKLDVVLEAISYIQSLQGNLEKSLTSRQFF